MKRIILYLLIIIPLLGSCQEKYNAPPYNQYEADLRKLPLETERIIIPKEWEKMDSLSFLRFKEINHIIIDADSIPSWIINFKKTTTIYSGSRKITALPKNIGDLENLQKVFIHYNSLEKISTSFCNLKKLEFLSFWVNRIDSLPNCIFFLEQLNQLDLMDNNLTVISSDIKNLRRLEKLLLDGNQIKELPESIYTLPNLKEISLGGNPLKNPEEIKKRFEEKGVKVLLK